MTQRAPIFDITDVTDCILLAADGNLFEYYYVDFARVVDGKIDVTISSEFDDCKLLHMGR